MKKIKLTILFLLATPLLANSNTLLKSNESLIKSDEIVYIESTSIESIIADNYLSFECSGLIQMDTSMRDYRLSPV